MRAIRASAGEVPEHKALWVSSVVSVVSVVKGVPLP